MPVKVDKTTKSRAIPIYQTSSYVLTTRPIVLIFARENSEIFIPDCNPTTDVFEKRGNPEGSVTGLASSGQAAEFLALNNICRLEIIL